MAKPTTHKSNRRIEMETPISLYPLTPTEALEAILKAPPEPNTAKEPSSKPTR